MSRIVLCALALLSAAVCALESARVDASSGAPRIVLDGMPVRARIFWGAPGSSPIRIKSAAAPYSFDFTARETELNRATLHFRFGHSAGNVFLDDIRVQEIASGKDVLPLRDFEKGPESFSSEWNVWPQKMTHPVGSVNVEPGAGRDGSQGLHIALQNPADGIWPDFHIHHQPNLALRAGQRYRMTFWARAEPARNLTIGFYRPGEHYTLLGGPPDCFESEIKLAGGAGVNFVSMPMNMPWPKPGEAPNWESVDAACKNVLEANPNALLIPRIGTDAAHWWREAHPGDVMVWDRGQHKDRFATVSSAAYRQDAARNLAALIAHVEEKFGPRVAGYHPGGQNTAEWFYPDTWGDGLNGYAEADLKAWREWLRAKYPGERHDDAAIPTPQSRRGAPSGLLRDPATERELIDFTEFQQEMMSTCVCELAKAARAASGGRKLVLFFYGYAFEFTSVGNGPATSGHYAMRRVLSSPDIDILCSPISYFDRGLGQNAPAMSGAESVALAGKMWLYEDDTHTYLATENPPGCRDHVDTLEKTNQELLRNTAQCALRNFGTWWMDLCASGWFNDAGMWEQMKRLNALDEPLLKNPLPYRPEVAAIIDEQSMQRVAFGGSAMTGPLVGVARRALGRMGAPFGQYLQDDVAAGKVSAKLNVFLTPWYISAGQRAGLMKKSGFNIWCYAPGWQSDTGTTLDGMRALTGFQTRKLPKQNAWAEPTDAGKKLGLSEGLGVRRAIEPLFAVTDATTEETLATYADGSAAVALRKTEGGYSLFVGPPSLSSELLRVAARLAGVHLFTQSDCNVYANGPYVVLHAASDGPVALDLGKDGPVRDLLTGEKIGDGPRFLLPMRLGETRILQR